MIIVNMNYFGCKITKYFSISQYPTISISEVAVRGGGCRGSRVTS